MADITIKKNDEFGTAFGGGMLLIRDGLDVSSFGIQLIRFPANADRYPEHDHAHDGQEEVYTVIDGQATLEVGGESYVLEPGTWVRVGPGEKRKFVTGASPCTMVAIGAIPGKAYEVQDFTKASAQS